MCTDKLSLTDDMYHRSTSHTFTPHKQHHEHVRYRRVGELRFTCSTDCSRGQDEKKLCRQTLMIITNCFLVSRIAMLSQAKFIYFIEMSNHSDGQVI
jgi:hypothetical protein